MTPPDTDTVELVKRLLRSGTDGRETPSDSGGDERPFYYVPAGLTASQAVHISATVSTDIGGVIVLGDVNLIAKNLWLIGSSGLPDADVIDAGSETMKRISRARLDIRNGKGIPGED